MRDRPKVTDRAQLVAENRRFSQIHPVSRKFKHLEGADVRRKPRRFSQETEDSSTARRAGNCRKSQISGGHTVPIKTLFKENTPFISCFLMGPFARTLFSRTLLLWPILCHSGQLLLSKVLEHLVCSKTSDGFRFWGPLARTNFGWHFAAFPRLGSVTLGPSPLA